MLDLLHELKKFRKILAPLAREFDPVRVETSGDIKFTPITPTTPEENEEQFIKSLWNLVVLLEFTFEDWKHERSKKYFIKHAPETIAPLQSNLFTPSLKVEWTSTLHSLCQSYYQLLLPLTNASDEVINDLIDGLGLPFDRDEFRYRLSETLTNLVSGFNQYKKLYPEEFVSETKPISAEAKQSASIMTTYFAPKTGLFAVYFNQRRERYLKQDMIENMIGFFSQGHYVPDSKKRFQYIETLQEAYQLYVDSSSEDKEHALRYLQMIIQQGLELPSKSERGLNPLLMQFQKDLHAQIRDEKQQAISALSSSPKK